MADNNMRICPNCNKAFIVFHQKNKFCSDNCRKTYFYNQRLKKKKEERAAEEKTFKKICPYCKKEFITDHKWKKYCSDNCRKEYSYKEHMKQYSLKQISIHVDERVKVITDPDRVGWSKHDLERYRKNAKKSQEELIKTTVYARDQGETYGQYVSHSQAAEEDAKMRARHLEWLANQKKGEKKT